MNPKQKPGDVLTQHAHGRTDNVRAKVQKAMEAIELDIENNDGIYPHHGGRLTVAEVCRVAGVHKVTLHGACHRDTTKLMIENWLQRLKATLITGRKIVRKTVTARADDWEARYKAVASKFNEMYAVDGIGKDNQIKELTEQVAALEAENQLLRTELNNCKVVRLPDAKTREKRPIDKDAPPCLILMRGVPGSGKSTRVAMLKEEKGYEHFEADMFFMKEGQYAFDESMLPIAHDWCLTKTREALKAGHSVVVANVFQTPESVRPYVMLGYPWDIVEANGWWASGHDVLPKKIKALREGWMSKEQLIRELSKLPKPQSQSKKDK